MIKEEINKQKKTGTNNTDNSNSYFCGHQGIALRDHQDYRKFHVDCEPEGNERNFRPLLRLRVRVRDINLKMYFENCGKNSTYIIWNIQNQIIEVCDSIIKQKIATEVNNANFFTVLADETCDISKIEQFSLCVRYLKSMGNPDYKICEEIL